MCVYFICFIFIYVYNIIQYNIIYIFLISSLLIFGYLGIVGVENENMTVFLSPIVNEAVSQKDPPTALHTPHPPVHCCLSPNQPAVKLNSETHVRFLAGAVEEHLQPSTAELCIR